MSLVIEDGSGLSTATSYVTVAEARAYALARGVTLAAAGDTGDATIEVWLIKAEDYLETLNAGWSGFRTWPPVLGQQDHEQRLSWPRSGAIMFGYGINNNVIPQQVKDAQCQLCIEQYNGINIMPSGTGAAIKRQKVDVLETEYATAYTSAPQPNMPKVDALLKPLLTAGYASNYIFRS